MGNLKRDLKKGGSTLQASNMPLRKNRGLSGRALHLCLKPEICIFQTKAG